jgi:FMN phosphatase YigB (HAD superfamily)
MDRRIMNPKYICLDVGNVLCTVDDVGFIEFVSYKLNVSTFKARRFLKRFQQLHDLGFTTMEDELMDVFDVKSPLILKEIVQVWNDSVAPHYGILNLLSALQAKDNLQVALLSNIGVEHAALLKDKLAVDGFYENSIKHLSCFVGARKPSTLYFQSFLMEHPEFRSCLYVDDLQANLDGAKPLGFQTFRLNLAEPNPNDQIQQLYLLIKNSAA